MLITNTLFHKCCVLFYCIDFISIMKKLSFLSNSIRAQLFIGKLMLITVAVLLPAIQASAMSGDTNPPEIIDFSFNSSVIDTTNNNQNVVVNIHAVDNDKGVNQITVRFRSPSGNQFVNAFINSQQRISGDDKDGVYSAAATFPRYCKAGTWSVSEIEASDEANNYKTLNTTEISAFGFSTELQVISNNEDTTAPDISNLIFSSSSIDTTNSSQNVTVTVRATDAFSGVRSVNVYFFLPSDDYLVGAELTNRQLVSGDDKDGVYTGTVTFAQGTDAGMWRIGVSVSDALGNQKTVSTDELAALDYPTELQVIGRTAQTPTQKSRKRVRFF